MYVRQWAVCRWNYPLQSVLLSMHTQCMYIYQARDVESHLEYVTNFFFFVVNFCVIFNYNLGENSQTPFTIRNNPPNHYVDKLPNFEHQHSTLWEMSFWWCILKSIKSWQLCWKPTKMWRLKTIEKPGICFASLNPAVSLEIWIKTLNHLEMCGRHCKLGSI